MLTEQKTTTAAKNFLVTTLSKSTSDLKIFTVIFLTENALLGTP